MLTGCRSCYWAWLITDTRRQSPTEQHGEQETTEPIIELPESPSPPPVADDEDLDRSEVVEEVVDKSQSRRRVDVEEVVRTNGSAGRERPNPLGVHPRKPIRTHQASPLATNGAGHSRKR